MVSGAGPGLGKSTLVTGLVSALRAAGQPVEQFAEEDILSRPEFAVVAETFVRDGIVPPARLSQASRALLARTARGDGWLVTDSLFPFSTSLYVWGHPEPAISGFLRALAALLPVDAILIYLDGDVRAGLERAARERGQAWVAGMVAKMSRFRPAVADLDGLIGLFAAERESTLRALRTADWPVAVVAGDSVQVLGTVLELLRDPPPRSGGAVSRGGGR
jgi:hypothetical protein